MSPHEKFEMPEVATEAKSGHLDEALQEKSVDEFEEVIELWKTYGGD